MYVSSAAETRRTTGFLKEAWTYWNKTHSPQLCLNKKASKVRFQGSKARLFLFIADYITLRRKMMKVGTMEGFFFSLCARFCAKHSHEVGDTIFHIL